MIQTLPYITQDWAGQIIIPSTIAWTWAAALFLPLIVSGTAIVVSALRYGRTPNTINRASVRVIPTSTAELDRQVTPRHRAA